MKKRKKNSRQRGSTTHGWGSMKKHRGKGNKGGAGMAGTGKRGDAKKPTIWKRKYFGKYGFKMKGKRRKVTPINIGSIQNNIAAWLKDNKIKKESDILLIDLNSLGYNKLLGKGLVKDKVNITVDSATEIAVKKISDKGGQVIKKEK